MQCNCYYPGDCDGSCQHPEPEVCEACGGSGVIVFATRIYEHGCGFAHDSTDERPCEDCLGTGRAISLAAWLNAPLETDDDLPF
jgi:DnaJ-class molecular chaperone